MTCEPCISSLVLVEDSLQTSSSDIRQLSLLSGIDMPAKSSENEQQTDGFLDCKCGKGMSDCLIHPSTPEAWTSFMRGSLAKIYQSLAKRPDLAKALEADCTEKSCVLLASFDRKSSSLRMSQQSLVEDLSSSFPTWPRWGLMRNGAVFVHPMSERTIKEIDGFFLPTPTTFDTRTDMMTGGASVYMDTKGLPRRKTANGSASMGLARLVQMWPTPTARIHKGGGGDR